MPTVLSMTEKEATFNVIVQSSERKSGEEAYHFFYRKCDEH